MHRSPFSPPINRRATLASAVYSTGIYIRAG